MLINSYSVPYIFWNIFLSLLPCWAVYFLSTHKFLQKNKLLFLLIFLFWFFLLPNTAYLFFMVRHLVDYCSDYNIYRVCDSGSSVVLFFFTYALIGLPTFYYALRKMTILMGQKFGILTQKLFPLILIPFTSIGVMFGLYERLNSWDVLLKNPLQILNNLRDYFSPTNLFSDFLIFTLLLYLIYYFTDFLLKWRR